MGTENLSVEYAGETLSRYDVQYLPGNAELRRVDRAILFKTSIAMHQSRLFDLAETLGEEGWLKALKLKAYAPRRSRQPLPLQQVLFSYAEAI